MGLASTVTLDSPGLGDAAAVDFGAGVVLVILVSCTLGSSSVGLHAARAERAATPAIAVMVARRMLRLWCAWWRWIFKGNLTKDDRVDTQTIEHAGECVTAP